MNHRSRSKIVEDWTAVLLPELPDTENWLPERT
jgi:hypothetical protein